MKISQHTILALIGVTLLLITAVVPAQADARDKGSRATRYAQNDSTAQGQNSKGQQRKRASRNLDTQGSATPNPQNNNQQDTRAPRDRDSQSDAPAVSRSEAAAIAERATGGRVLSVREDGRYWQVKVLVDEKRVRFVSVDMRSGAVR